MDEIMHVEALIQGHVEALIRAIEGAIDLLEAPGSWTQHALARNGQAHTLQLDKCRRRLHSTASLRALERSGNSVPDKIGPNSLGYGAIYDVLTSTLLTKLGPG